MAPVTRVRALSASPGPSGSPNPEWDEVKKAAERHGVAAAEYVRETILDMARRPEDTDSTEISGDLAPLIERTFRYTYMLATKMRDDMMAEGHGEEMEKLIRSARETQGSLVQNLRNRAAKHADAPGTGSQESRQGQLGPSSSTNRLGIHRTADAPDRHRPTE